MIEDFDAKRKNMKRFRKDEEYEDILNNAVLKNVIRTMIRQLDAKEELQHGKECAHSVEETVIKDDCFGYFKTAKALIRNRKYS